MIDTTTGILKINENLIFSPCFTYDDFVKTSYFQGQDSIRMIYLDQKQIIDGKTYIVGFFFKEKKIYMVSLIICDENISESEEKKRKVIHDNILLENGINSGKEYNWGKIQSEYDKRSNISSINVYYKFS